MNNHSRFFLPTDVVIDILHHCNRLKLCELRLVNDRFCTIVDKHFVKAPYLVVGKLRLSCTRAIWRNHKGCIIRLKDPTVIRSLLECPYVRIDLLLVNISNRITEHYQDVLKMLASYSHLWHGNELYIRVTFNRSDDIPEGLIKEIRSAAKLCVKWKGSLQNMGSWLNTSCICLRVIDTIMYKSGAAFPFDNAINFLFTPTGDESIARELHLEIPRCTGNLYIPKLFERIQEKFCTNPITHTAKLTVYGSWCRRTAYITIESGNLTVFVPKWC
ncbi:hypothetical protein Ddc_03835 [Ditylenchus destructor]|nr:hypothetical protein Ddc_03835 [Ditylenchus destructor]